MNRVLPILFNTDMVRAILDGRKTVTRRVMKIQPWDNGDWCKHEIKNIFKDEPREFCCRICGLGVGPSGHSVFKAPYQPGDILYVRETWGYDVGGIYIYKASYEECVTGNKETDAVGNKIKWHPSIHMPKEAARIWLKVTDVRVERLQDMWASDVAKEGLRFNRPHTAKEMLSEFSILWNSTVKKSDLACHGWAANPWVWVIEFERCEVNTPDRCNACDCYNIENAKCERIGINGKVGTCWMEKSEGEY